MLIDWFTVVAQLINFVILLVALKFLLFDRIVEAMDERRARIEQQRRDAEEARAEAEEEAEQLEQERRELEDRRDELLDEARDQAEQRKRELLEEARAEVDEQEQRWRESLGRKQDRLARHLQREAGERVVATTRRVLSDLADADLEDAIVAGFVADVQSLDEEERSSVAKSLSESGTAVVRTGFELSDDRRDAVREAVGSLTESDAVDLEWERDPEILAGIQIETETAHIGWTVDDYLDELLETFTQAISTEIAPAEGDEEEAAGADDESADEEPADDEGDEEGDDTGEEAEGDGRSEEGS